MPTSPISCSCMKRTNSSSFSGFALPSISKTSCPGGVRPLSRNIHRCGMKFFVTPLSGLYKRIFIFRFPGPGLSEQLPNHTHTKSTKSDKDKAMRVKNTLQTIKPTLRMLGDYNTCVWDRTYQTQDKPTPSVYYAWHREPQVLESAR